MNNIHVLKYNFWLNMFLFGLFGSFNISAQTAAEIDSLKQLLKQSRSDSISINIYCELGGLIAETDSGKAFMYVHKALSLSEKSSSEHGKAYSLHMLGYIYDCHFMTADALNYYRKSLAIKEKIGDLKGLSATMANIGMLYYYGGEYDKALENLRAALSKRLSSDDPDGAAAIYNNMAAVYRRKKEYDSSELYYRKSLQIKEKKGDLKGLAASYSNLSTLYQYKGDYEKAMQFENSALEIEYRRDDKRGIAHSLMSLGHISYWKADYIKAKEQMGASLKIADSIAAYDIMARGFSSMSEIDSILGNLKSSFEYFKKYIEYKDKVFEEKQQQRQDMLKSLYESDRKDKELEVKNSELVLLQKESEIQQQRILFWTIFGISAILILSVLYYSYLQKKKNLKLLQEKNTAIAASLKEKEMLLREIHHRVKNNLQIVSGLLSWQSQQSNDEAMKKTVTEGKNRLKSMAMLHQHLYSTEDNNLKSIPVQEYIAELTTELAASYGLQNEKIAISTDIAPIELDIDMMVPMGLILTELISNAIKHAFPDRQGKISVELKLQGDMILLSVRDNGVGIENERENEGSKNFGLKLVEMMAQKLDASMEIDKKSGTSVLLNIKYNQAA